MRCSRKPWLLDRCYLNFDLVKSNESIFNKLWNFEFKDITLTHQHIVLFGVFFGGAIYVVGEVLFALNPLAGGFSITEALNPTNIAFIDCRGWKRFFPQIWLSIALSVVVFRLFVIFHSYFKSKKVLGETGFTRYMFTYFSSFVFALMLGLGLMYVLLGFAKLAGFEVAEGTNVFASFIVWLQGVIDNRVPTLINVKSYWLAIFLSVFLSALPGYFIHWITHKFRFFWYVFHRCHHCPEFLHPLGAPPAFAFEFALVFPAGLVAIVTSKLIYTEPLIMEMAIYFTFIYAFEIFNHSIVHYDFAFRNGFIRNMSRLSGNGVYHLVHHSAKPNDQTINLGGSPFLFWDRIFGTYRKPYEQAPPLGLTNQPKLKLNPFRIILSGISQILFELKENKNWWVRLKILFGPIHYQPPKTKEYLILGY